MELKTKEGKYFSELGSWSDLLRVGVLVIISRFFGFGLVGNIVAIVVLAGLLWGVPYLMKK